MKFNDLELDNAILKAVEEAGYEKPTPIQAAAIPHILKGSDVCASAQTGTGKSASFLLPAMQRLLKPGKGPRVLILVPTRELAMQVAQEATKYCRHLPHIKTVCIYGGAPYPIQNRQLSRNYDILVATPGRLLDHMERNRIDFSNIELLILDEADRMLDMGFIQPVEEIAAATPTTRQTLLFSATLRGSVLKLTRSLQKNPVEIRISADHAQHTNIEQRLHYVNNLTDKQRILEILLDDPSINQAIVFTSTKRQADQLLLNLLERGQQAAALHGDMNQRQRTRTIGALRNGKIKVLVATDVAARGIDVQTISHVINFDLPMRAEDYVHRIGRTGRAGHSASNKGLALSFAAPRDAHLVKQIEKFTGQKMIPHKLPEFAPQHIPVRSKKKSFHQGYDHQPSRAPHAHP